MSLALFDHPRAAHKMQSLVYLHLPPDLNSPEIFGEQVAANENDEVEFFNQRLLIAAAGLDLEEVVGAIHETGWGWPWPPMLIGKHTAYWGIWAFSPDGLEIDARGNFPLRAPQADAGSLSRPSRQNRSSDVRMPIIFRKSVRPGPNSGSKARA